MARMREHQTWLKEELDRCVEFWLKNGMDPVHGGVYTCLDREGKVFSTDKSVWMQGRCGWIFAHLCRLYGPKDEWLAASKSSVVFFQAGLVLRRQGGQTQGFVQTVGVLEDGVQGGAGVPPAGRPEIDRPLAVVQAHQQALFQGGNLGGIGVPPAAQQGEAVVAQGQPLRHQQGLGPTALGGGGCLKAYHNRCNRFLL